MSEAATEMDLLTDPPILARVAGLPAEAVESFAGGLGAGLARIEETEESLARIRAELVERLHGAIQGRPAEQRRFLLSLKRHCFNGRSLRNYRQGEVPWAGLPETLVPLLARAAGLEDLQDQLLREHEEAYAGQVERERAALRGFLADPGFLRGVALSSSVLMENLARLSQPSSQGSSRRVRRLEVSLLRYVSRAALKLSPFSTLTRIGLASPAPPPGDHARGRGLDLVDPARWSEGSTVRLQRSFRSWWRSS